jgi:hypothetical protein
MYPFDDMFPLDLVKLLIEAVSVAAIFVRGIPPFSYVALFTSLVGLDISVDPIKYLYGSLLTVLAGVDVVAGVVFLAVTVTVGKVVTFVTCFLVAGVVEVVGFLVTVFDLAVEVPLLATDDVLPVVPFFFVVTGAYCMIPFPGVGFFGITLCFYMLTVQK